MFCYKCSAEIPDESVHLAEGQDKVPHELTKREAQALLEYKEEVKRYS